MANYVLNKTVKAGAVMSANVMACQEMFGIGADSEQEMAIISNLKVRIGAGDVVYVTGGSGAGKSTALGLLKEQMAGAVDLRDIELPSGRAVIDCFETGFSESLGWLGMAGLSDAFAMVRTVEQLSDGQRYRLRLAVAMSRKPTAIVIDEYCNHLDRIAAAITSVGVRKYADQYDTAFVAATSHDDIMEDLSPDVIVIVEAGGRGQVYYPKRVRFED